jgi:hypothetical protein
MNEQPTWEVSYDQVWWGGVTFAAILAATVIFMFWYLPKGTSQNEIKQIVAEVIAADRAHLDTAMKSVMEAAVKRGHAVYLDASGTRYFQWLPPCNSDKDFKLLPEDCAVPLAEIYGPASSGGKP